MRKLLCCLGIVFGLSWGARLFPRQSPGREAPVVLTLEEAVTRVLARNPSLKEAQDTIAVFEAQVSQARSRLLPGVRGDLSYSRISPLQEITIPGFGTFQLYPADNYDVSAGVRQLVYDFDRTRKSVELAQSRVTGAADQWTILRRNLQFETARLFYSVLFLQDNIRVQRENLEVLDDHLAVARKKLEAGTATELEVLNTQVRIVAARDQVIDLENALETRVVVLRRLLGFSEQAPLVFQGEFAYQPPALEAEALVREAWEKRPENEAVRNQMRTAEIQARLARLFDRPSLSLNLMAGFKNGFIPNLNTWKFNYVAAVQADVPIFDGNLGRAKQAEAEANVKTIQDRTKDVADMIRAEVLQALADVKASREKLETVDVNVQRAGKALDYAKASYEAGTVTNLDLLDTEEARAQAELVRIRARYRLVLSGLALARAVGNTITD